MTTVAARGARRIRIGRAASCRRLERASNSRRSVVTQARARTAHRSGPGQGGPPASPRESSARLRRGQVESVSRSGPSERIAFHGELESKGLTKRGRCALPARTRPARSRRVAGITSPAGRPVERTGARGRTARPHGHRRPAKVVPVQDPSRPSRTRNFSKDLKAQIRAPVAPEILDENDTPGRPKESCTSEPGTRMGPKTIRGHPPHARHPSRP
jgi:hypothetical protein